MTKQPLSKSPFSQAISSTESLISRINAYELSEDEIKQVVSSILTTKHRARGFFATYLTNDTALADKPSPGIIEGINISIEISSELLVKNLAMSTAMVVTHKRNRNLPNVEDSLRVVHRTSNLIQKLNSNLLQMELDKLNLTINGESKEYQDFLKRWGHDTEQKQAIKRTIFTLIC